MSSVIARRFLPLVIGLALGCGGAPPPPSPAPVASPATAPEPDAPAAEAPPVIQLAAGAHHTCALLRNGTVRCWGRASEGQLGDPLVDLRTNPEPTAVMGLDDAVEIAVGETFGCARRRSGPVACWGQMFGQLAARQIATVQETQGVPMAQLAAGRFHACLRTTDQELRCWGRIGRFDHTPSDEYATRPTAMDGLERVADVALGDGGGCVRRDDGEVVCWDRGPRSAEQPYGRTTTWPVAAARGALQLAARGTRACAIRPDRSVICWDARAEPAVVPGVEDAQELAVGAEHACARGADARVRCWANGAAPELVASLDDVAQIVAGAAHTCARTTDGHVLCWGGAARDVLGPTVRFASERPVAVALGPEVEAIDAAGARACARTRDGGARCWGDDVMSPAPVDGLAGVTELAVAPEHACARLEDRTVRCWTDGAPAEVPGLREVDQVVVAEGYSAALVGGRVWGWGAVPDGRDATDEPRAIAGLTDVVELSATPAMLCARLRRGTVSCVAGRAAAPVRFVSGATAVHGACATLRDGRVRCWTSRLAAQDQREAHEVLDGPATRAGSCWIAPDGGVHCASFGATAFGGLTGARAIVQGEGFHCALLQDGVRCWGANARGQLGDGRGGVARATPIPIAIPETEPVMWAWSEQPPVPRPTRERAGGERCWLGEPRRVAGSERVVGHVTLAWHGDRLALLFKPGGVSVTELGAQWLTAHGEPVGDAFALPVSMGNGRVGAYLGEDALYLVTRETTSDPARLTVVGRDAREVRASLALPSPTSGSVARVVGDRLHLASSASEAPDGRWLAYDPSAGLRELADSLGRARAFVETDAGVALVSALDDGTAVVSTWDGASVATHVLEDLVLDRDRFGHPRGDYPHDAAWDEGALVVLAGHPDRGWVSYRREQESFRFGLDGHRIGEPEPASDALPWRDRVVVSPEPQWDFIRYVGPRGLARVKITADGRWTYNGAVVATTWAGDGFVAAYADRPGTSLWTVRIDCSPRPGS